MTTKTTTPDHACITSSNKLPLAVGERPRIAALGPITTLATEHYHERGWSCIVPIAQLGLDPQPQDRVTVTPEMASALWPARSSVEGIRAAYLLLLAGALGFTGVVRTSNRDGQGDNRPSLGEGPLCLALWAHDEELHGWGVRARVPYCSLSITHRASGNEIPLAHPLREHFGGGWNIPATARGVKMAQAYISRLEAQLRVDWHWANIPSNPCFVDAIKSRAPKQPEAAKVERDACRLFRVDVREHAKAWGLGKTDTEKRVRELVNTRFVWRRG